ncbi:MAG: hypothetical protein ABSG73_14980 [Candidatus Aminicenantales bacterium]|jgi:hypothetical protein
MNNDEKELIEKTLKNLVHPAFQSISEYLLSQKIQHQCNREFEKHVVTFTGKNGKVCEFSVCATTRMKRYDVNPFSCIVISYRTGNFNTANTGCDRAEEYTSNRILEVFKNKFTPFYI